MIAKVYHVDPLVCLRCGQRMSMLAFVSDQHSISRILEHLGLRPLQQDKPRPSGVNGPFHAGELERQRRASREAG